MRYALRCVLAAGLVAATSHIASAQQAVPASTATLATDLLTDLGQVETKIMALARAIPADKYGWRPATGVRSIGEVLLHVAAHNYLLPAAQGFAPDTSTGIKGDDYKTAVAFEKRPLDPDATIAQLERSFAFLKKSVGATTTARLGERVTMFGQSFTVQQIWILTATHLHEHLGQLIAVPA